MSQTYKEIHETFDSLKRINEAVAARYGEFEALLKRDTPVVFVGCGSSYSISKSLARIARMHLCANAVALAGGDILVHASEYAKSLEGAAIFCVSRSGSTSELMLAFEALRAAGCGFTLASFACTEDSALARMSEKSLEMPWAFDKSVCQTRTVSSLYFAGAMLIARVAGDKALIEGLERAIERGPEYLAALEPKAKEIAALGWDNAVVLADAQLDGIAEEGALAFKEICQLPSNFYNVLDSRHGPMVLFDEKTLILIAASTPVSEYERAFVADMVKKGSTVLVYSDLEAQFDGATNIAFGEALPTAARGVPMVLVCQLLSYFKSDLTGANPDKPTGLDAWIKL